MQLTIDKNDGIAQNQFEDRFESIKNLINNESGVDNSEVKSLLDELL